MSTYVISTALELKDMFSDALKRYQDETRKASVVTEQTKNSVFGLSNGLLSAVKSYASVGAAIAAFKMVAIDGLRRAMEQEQRILALRFALERLGEPIDMGKVNQYIDELADHLNVADDEIRETALTLARTGDISAAGIMKMLPALAGVKAEGKNMAEVAQAIALALQGSTRGLRQFGIELAEGATKAEVLDAIRERFAEMGAAAEQAANTSSGQLRGMFEAWNDAKEKFGEGFLSTLGVSEDSIRSFGEALEGAGRAAAVIGTGLGVMLQGLTVSVKMVYGMVETNVIGLVEMFLRGAQAIGDGWKGVQDVVSGVAGAIGAGFRIAMFEARGAIQAALEWIVEKYNALAAWVGATPIKLGFDRAALESEMAAAGPSRCDFKKPEAASTTCSPRHAAKGQVAAISKSLRRAHSPISH